MKLIKTLKLNAGPTGAANPLSFEPSSVTVFVGPNHSGKSLLLQEIRERMPRVDAGDNQKVLQGMEFNPFDQPTRDRLRDSFKRMTRDNDDGASVTFHLDSGTTMGMSKPDFESFLRFASLADLRRFGRNSHNLINRLCLLLGGAERLRLLDESQRGDLRQPAAGILGVLFQHDDKRRELQKIVREAFGWHLLIDPSGQSNFRACVSATEPPRAVERSLSDEALIFFNKATGISAMSDGVRAYCGMMAAVIASEANVLLIDEPEAFLHPALCMNLAKELCRKSRESGHQIFISTHSAPFIMGCIQAGIELNIVRLTYRNAQATSRVLGQTELVPLMRQPLLRSMGALSGIFYEAVVVTESDSDRTFYDEINHRCVSNGHPSGIGECLFLNAQNWQTTTRIAAPLRRLGIAAAVVVDVDVLFAGESTGFQNLLESAGLPEGTRHALGQLRGKFHSKSKEEKETIKKSGMRGLLGDDKQDLENLIVQLGAYGIFVVPNGELESWLSALPRTTTADKREWLLQTFEAMGEDPSAANYVKPDTGDVWDFIGTIRRWLHDPNRRGMPASHPVAVSSSDSGLPSTVSGSDSI